MSFLERISALPQKKLALLAAELYERSQGAGKGVEPIAITAMACRMPGDCNTPAAFWSFLAGGGDATEAVSDERLALVGAALEPDAAPRPCGTFLRDVDRFDATVFGISAKEAASMDPQQRLLLEVCWEALENAGTPIDELQDSATGVFVGISGTDYALLTHASERAGGYAVTGVANAIAAGRISYVFGLNGPSTAIDTACSASAAAIHLACQSLRARECERVLAGGVNLALLPEITQTLSGMDALAPDGRCKAFSADADGFGRGEGCAVIVLRRLSDAVARGETVLGVIRGSAWNQDGRSSGLTAPNGLAQERVVRAALEAAGVRPDEISYVEAHGTGTALGDPIEISALSRVFAAEPRTAGPLRVGSVKTNVGHLEAAAGVAGVMKVVLAMHHERIPPHLHAAELNPRIEWATLPIEIPAAGAPWPRSERPRIAGISSFGFSGTNVHLIVAEPPAPVDVNDDARSAARPTILTASAKSHEALLELAARYAGALERGDVTLARFAAAANLTRSHFAHRLVLIGDDARTAAEQLRMFAAGDPRSPVRSAFIVTHRPPELVFVADGALSVDANDALLERWRGFGLDADVVDAAAANGARQVVLRDGGEPALLAELAELYLAGVAIDWRPLHRDVTFADVVLPNYPFERQRHWAEIGRRTRTSRDGARDAGDGIYRITWNAPEGTGAAPLPAPAAVFEALRPHVPKPAAGDDFAALARFEDDAETFAVHAVLNALRALRPELAAGSHVPDEDPCAALGVVPEHRRLLERSLRLLTDHGVAQRDASGWTIARELPNYDLEAEIAALRLAYPSSKPEIDVAARTVELPRVLRGEISGVDVLFPNGSFEIANALYRETPAARVMNALVGKVIEQLTATARRPLRVLEIGAGTGGTTAAVLAALPPGTDYVFTDLSTGFFAAARATFAQYPNVRYEVLDVENRARIDELAAQPFDIVVAANVLHATASVRQTLANARALLREGGALVMLEATVSLAIADITFGATDGWSKRADMELRPFGPLLTAQTWREVLAGEGFEVATLPVLPEFGVVTEQQTIVVARRMEAMREGEVVVVHRGAPPADARAAFELAGVPATFHALSGFASLTALDALLDERAARALVFVGPQDARAPADAAQRSTNDLLDLAQLVVARPDRRLAFWIVTAGAQPAFGPSFEPSGGALWGLGRVLASEYPALEARLADLSIAEDWEPLAALIGRGSAEPELALSGEELRVPRLEPLDVPAVDDAAAALAGDGAYVVTGAFGVLGLLTSRRLAERGAGALILAGRREPAGEAEATIDGLRASGTSVEVVVADVGTPAGIEAIFAAVARTGRRLRGVVHSAAALDDAAIPQQTYDTLATAFAPKARAAWLLHERTVAEQLDFFVLYSSSAALTGSPGQANYAAANGFLDALAHYRRSLGLPATSINWGLWEASGAAVKRDQIETWTTRGVVPMSSREGLDAFERVLHANESQVAVLGNALAAVLPTLDPRAVAPLLRGLSAAQVPQSAATAASAAPAGAFATLTAQLAGAAPSDRHRLLVDFVRARCAELLNLDRTIAIPDDRALIELGLDSLVGLELRNDLQNVLEVKLSSTLLFDYPTIGDLSRYLELLAGAPEAGTNGRTEEVERVSI